MGNFVEKVKRGLAWIGSIIARFIRWLCGYLRDIAKKVSKFLMRHEEKIKKADEPKTVAKIVAIDKAIKELNIIKEKESKNISQKDKDLCKELLDDDAEYDKALNNKELEKKYDEFVEGCGY